jgi:hypothetical protein
VGEGVRRAGEGETGSMGEGDAVFLMGVKGEGGPDELGEEGPGSGIARETLGTGTDMGGGEGGGV